MDRRIKKDFKDLDHVNYALYQEGIIPFNKGYNRERHLGKIEKSMLKDDKRYDKKKKLAHA